MAMQVRVLPVPVAMEVTLFLFDTLKHGMDGANLIVAAGDAGVDQLLSQWLVLRRMY